MARTCRCKWSKVNQWEPAGVCRRHLISSAELIFRRLSQSWGGGWFCAARGLCWGQDTNAEWGGKVQGDTVTPQKPTDTLSMSFAAVLSGFFSMAAVTCCDRVWGGCILRWVADEELMRHLPPAPPGGLCYKCLVSWCCQTSPANATDLLLPHCRFLHSMAECNILVDRI